MPKSESFNRDIIVISVFWLVCATVIFFNKWESVSALNLNDNDDYMRFVQFQDWMTTGRWYLEPMTNFNADDGLIIHWSRFPDLMLSLVAFPLLFLVDDNLAYAISISVVPLFYLLLYVLACFYLCEHYFGRKYRFISMMFSVSSPTIIHFLPGAIDHHNIQLILASLFLSITPINLINLKQSWRVYAQSVFLSLSLWTGMDNILLFMVFFIFYTVYGCFFSREWFGYVSKLYVTCAFLAACTLLLNRPYDEFFVFKYDEISFILIILFVSGWVFVNVYNRLNIHRKTSFKGFYYLLLSVFCVYFRLLFFTPLSPVLCLLITLRY